MKKLLFFIILPFSLFSQNQADTTKRILDSISKKHITYLSEGNAVKFLALYSERYTDLGGGTNGDGTVDYPAWETKLNTFFLSDDIKKIKGKPIEELLDVGKQKILNYTEIVANEGEIKVFSFELKEGDYFVSFPPLENSLLSEGWHGFFRLENGQWKVIAGD